MFIASSLQYKDKFLKDMFENLETNIQLRDINKIYLKKGGIMLNGQANLMPPPLLLIAQSTFG